jgi:hypothetical protein
MKTLVKTLAVTLVVVGVIRLMPDFVRYMKMRAM